MELDETSRVISRSETMKPVIIAIRSSLFTLLVGRFPFTLDKRFYILIIALFLFLTYITSDIDAYVRVDDYLFT